jgi:hypothetical protein
VSDIRSTTVKVDRTAPATTVTGLASGGTLGVATILGVAATATDATSGVDGVTLTVDGKALAPAGKLDGTLLGLGAHELAATAKDKAGNTSVTKVPFTVVASYAEAGKLVERYRVAKVVPIGTAAAMRAQLALAEQQQQKGHNLVAAVALDQFVAQARTVRDVPARTLLIAVGQDLLARL